MDSKLGLNTIEGVVAEGGCLTTKVAEYIH